jgi:flagellar M-ring protein FliF
VRTRGRRIPWLATSVALVALAFIAVPLVGLIQQVAWGTLWRDLRTPEASAAIVLKVRGKLEPQQVNAIRHLTASAVNGLKPERVSIVDETGRLLADGAGGPDNMGGGADDRKIAYEQRLRDQVEGIVSSVVGPGHARVQLTADFDLNRITQTSDKFDPDGRVLRSSQTREEQSSTGEGSGGGRDGA